MTGAADAKIEALWDALNPDQRRLLAQAIDAEMLDPHARRANPHLMAGRTLRMCVTSGTEIDQKLAGWRVRFERVRDSHRRMLGADLGIEHWWDDVEEGR